MKALVCWLFGHQMDWRSGPGRFGGTMMRGRCRRCGHLNTALPSDTPLPSEAYPALREFVRRHRLPEKHT